MTDCVFMTVFMSIFENVFALLVQQQQNAFSSVLRGCCFQQSEADLLFCEAVGCFTAAYLPPGLVKGDVENIYTSRSVGAALAPASFLCSTGCQVWQKPRCFRMKSTKLTLLIWWSMHFDNNNTNLSVAKVGNLCSRSR